MLSAVGGRGIGVGECGFCLKGVEKDVASVPLFYRVFFLFIKLPKHFESLNNLLMLDSSFSVVSVYVDPFYLFEKTLE